MKRLSASDLLHIWEWGQGKSPTAQALMMLSVVYPEASPQQLAELPIGQRDGLLLKLRSHTFGTQIQATAHCPECAEALEYSLSVEDIVVSPASKLAPELAFSATETAAVEKALYHWQSGDYSIDFRLPNSADVLAATDQSTEFGSTSLMQRCLVSVHGHGESMTPEQIPQDVLLTLEEHIAQQDPQADIRLNLSCLSCKHQWQVLFDIVSFFWREIAIAAQRLLQEVHLLASVYSWREADILAMTPTRRMAYLNQITGQITSSSGQISRAAGL